MTRVVLPSEYGGGAELTIDGESTDLSGGALSVAAGLAQGTYSWKYFETNFGLLKGQADLSSSIADGIGGTAGIESVYASACFKIPIFGHELKLGVSGNVGGIGAKCKVGAKTEIGASFIGGGSIIVEWD